MIKTKTFLYEFVDTSLQGTLYLLALFKFSIFFLFQWKKVKSVYKDPKKAQDKVLHYILSKNKEVSYLRQYHLKDMSYSEFIKLPIRDYEAFRSYVEKNINRGEKTLTQSSPVFFAKTSGTQGLPKYIPVTEEGKRLYRKGQNLMSFNLFLSNYKNLNGKIFAISSPMKEERLKKGYFAGSMSGMLREKSPAIVRKKFVIPLEILSISSYKDKYLLLALIALCEANIALLSTANPSTLLKLLSVLNVNRKKLMQTLQSGNLKNLDLTPSSLAMIKKSTFMISPKRKKQMIALLQSDEDIDYFNFWPQLKSVVTWTAGSCAYLIPQLKNTLPLQCSIIDLGYLSSEFRGTVVLEGHSVPAIQETFFEFSECLSWESGEKKILRLHELKQGEKYYIFVTTFNGLYRYDINDIVKVTGYYMNTPCLKFVQKGKGTTNITGEKLYENQLVKAVNKVQTQLQFSIPFFICLADPTCLSYTLYAEGVTDSVHIFQKRLHSELCDCNIEYREKTRSERLKPIQIVALEKGTGEKYKKHCVSKGQRDSQLKIQHLQYKKDINYDFSNQIITDKQ